MTVSGNTDKCGDALGGGAGRVPPGWRARAACGVEALADTPGIGRTLLLASVSAPVNAASFRILKRSLTP